MEKFKDLFHDFSDVFLALLIVFIMFLVITFNLGDWFDNNNVVAVDYQNIIEDPVTQEDLTFIEENLGEAQAEEQVEKMEDEVENHPSVEVVVVNHVQVTIPNGTPGVGIANILLEHQLIENAHDFIQTSEDLNLSLSLKSGTFNIPLGSTTEEIVKIIARQN